MYFSAEQIKHAITELGRVHPFFGITFLACKKENLPIGTTMQFHLDEATKQHMDNHHRINPGSEFYFQPFRQSGEWVKKTYPSGKLRTINTKIFAEAFIHPPGKPLWGWSDRYVEFFRGFISDNLDGKMVPAFALAVWLYKDVDISERSPTELILRFMEDYFISEEERFLFDYRTTRPNTEPAEEKPATWRELQPFIGRSPDAPPVRGCTLGYLGITGAGPAPRLRMEPSERLTIITGDNGLGKTFLLDCAWWALTGTWADRPVLPRSGSADVSISFEIREERQVEGHGGSAQQGRYDRRSQAWVRTGDGIPGLVLYVRADGSFAVWDPVRRPEGEGDAKLTARDVWDGQQGKTEGLIRDWGRWQNSQTTSPFNTFAEVLKGLSPPDLAELSPGGLVRLPGEIRDIPTIRHSYGEIPIVSVSAGVQRIVAIAYLLVWLLDEHRIQATLTKRIPENRMVILIDELEAHLHPKWQRLILPAIMSVIDSAIRERFGTLNFQIIVSTHSPLVLASVESIFDDQMDSLLHLNLRGGHAALEQIEFIKCGNVSRWLTSQIFGLNQARSQEAEEAILNAMEIQERRLFENTKVSRDRVKQATRELKKHLAGDDEFWPRWIGFAKSFDIEI